MAARGLGLDEGSATVKLVEVEKQGGTFVPIHATSLPAAEEGIDGAALKAALAKADVKSKSAVLGLTGKDLVIKYQQVPQVADFQLRKIVDFELEEIRKQSGDELAADFNVMPASADLTNDDIVLLALSREQRLAERSGALADSGVSAHHFTPNAVALYHAFRIFGPATSGDALVVSIGKTTSDFAVIRDGDLLYARSVSSGGDVLTDALSAEFNVGKPKAESLKRELGDLRPRDRRTGLSAQAEKVSYALEGAAGRLFSMVQSTLQLAKSQMQLNQINVAKVWLTGGATAMKGLEDYLAASLSLPVQRFDPIAEAGLTVAGGAGTADMTIALGLAVMAADGDAWSVEIVGAAERKRREWKTKHVFSIAAILLVAIYLGVSYWHLQKQYAVARGTTAKLQQEQKRRQENAAKFDALRTARAELAAKVDVLEKKKAAGDGLLRSLDLLVTHLPEDLWAGNLELQLEDPPGVAKDKGVKQPVVVIDGAGKSLGKPIDETYAKFVQAVHALPDAADERPGSEPTETQTTGREQRFAYQFRLVYLQHDRPPPDAPTDDTKPAPDAKKPAAPKKPGSH